MKLEDLWPEKMVAIDTEGTGTYHAELLQFSAIDGRGEVLLNTYIKPEHNTSWKYAEKVTGITPEMVAGAQPLSFYRARIEEILHHAEVIVGYALQNDLLLLERCGIRLPRRLLFLDPAIPFQQVYAPQCGRVQMHRLAVCAAYYGFEAEGWHDSLCDARAALYCCEAMIQDGTITEALPFHPRPKVRRAQFFRHRREKEKQQGTRPPIKEYNKK